MSPSNLKRIVGLAAILIILTIVFFVASKLAVAEKVIEGPHLFYEDKSLKKIMITTQGNKITQEIKEIELGKEIQTLHTVAIPGSDRHFNFALSSEIANPEEFYPKSGKILVLSDVEGDFKYLESILKGNEVIDSEGNWTYDNGHLMLLGDIFDRGKQVTECLWLIYKLEQQAIKSGGQVHLILGNHEIMALQGDDRYVVRRYKRICKKLGIEYKDFFGPKTELGRWLRTKNSVEVIGNTIFAHGGLSVAVAETKLSISDINDIVRDNIDKDPAQYADDNAKLIFGSLGPLWYRGYVDKEMTNEDISLILQRYNVDKIVIGHTLVNEITAMYDKKVLAIDVDRKGKNYSALLIENGTPFKTNSDEEKIKL